MSSSAAALLSELKQKLDDYEARNRGSSNQLNASSSNQSNTSSLNQLNASSSNQSNARTRPRSTGNLQSPSSNAFNHGFSNEPCLISSDNPQNKNLRCFVQKIPQKMSNLYAPYSTNYRAKSRKGSSKQPVVYTLPRVILLPSPSFQNTPHTKKIISAMYKSKLISEKVKLSTADSATGVMDTLKKSFKGLISDSAFEFVSEYCFEILKDEGGVLFVPNIRPNEPLDGEAIKDIFLAQKKKLYIRADKPIYELIPDELSDFLYSDHDDCEFASDDALSNSTFSQDTKMEDRKEEGVQVTGAASVLQTEVPNMGPDPQRNDSPTPDSSLLDVEDHDSEYLANLQSESNSKNFFPQTAPDEMVQLSTKLKHLSNTFIGTKSTDTIFIRRNNVFHSLKRKYDQNVMKEDKKLHMKFTDDLSGFDVTEAGVDVGGLTREVFTLCFKEVMDSVMFEGPDDDKCLTCHQGAIARRDYFYLGRFIAVAAMQESTFPLFISADMLYLITGNHSMVNYTRVHNPNILENMKKVDDASSVEDLANLVLSDTLVFSLAGITFPITSLDQKDKIKEGTVYFRLISAFSL